MSNYRYSFSFIISSILFTLIGFSFLFFVQKIEKPKKNLKSVIKIAIITPVVKKNLEKKPIEKKTIVPVITPPIPIPPKTHKKVKPRKNIKKKAIKKRIVKKKKHVKKRIVKKKVIKKRVVKKTTVHKKVIHKRIPKKIEPQIESVYIPTPQPIPVIKPVIHIPVQKKVFTPAKKPIKVDRSAEKRQFLTRVRSQIIANKKYPKMALRRHIQGAVKIKFDITSSGDVSNIRYINGKKILQKGARKAIEKSFPMTIPSSLINELPIKDIYLTIHFNIN